MRDQLIFRCPACSIRARVPSDANRIHCACGYVQLGGVTPGLGDHVAAALHRIGLTQSRYVRAKAAIGLKPKCGCKKRQAKLNELGRKVGIG